ncbi:MAG TPA: capsule assembly Wzi family protein [candidate division Zixibacteria bacterium]|nr:capsule assembly Wzi family protein [candidate division Zixibacteria bacterium]
MSKITKAFFAVPFLLFASFPRVLSNQLEEISLNSWVYPIIDELHFQGFFPNLFVADKPYTRGEISSYLATARQGLESGIWNLRPHQQWLFQRLFDEFKLELAPKENQNIISPSLVFRWGSAFNLKSDFHKEVEPFHKPVFNAFLGGEVDNDLYFRSRIRVENHVSQNPSVRARSWTHNDLGGTLDDTYLKYRHKYFGLIFGRQRLQWGPGFAEVDLISPNPPPFDMIRLTTGYKALRFQFFFTRLDDAINPSTPFDTVPRYFSAHRFGIQPLRWLQLNLSEVVLYGGPNRKLEWYYLMPFVPFYGEQYNNFKDDNPLWSIDWTLTPLKNFAHYGELLIDDFQIDCIGGDCSEPQQIGIRLGFFASSLGPYKNNFLNLEYSRINNYVYGQNRYYNLYLYHNVPIGAPLGPSGDYVLLRYRQYFSRNFDAGFSAEYRRKGQDSIAVQTVKVPFSEFPLGVVEKTLTFQFSAAYQYKANLFARVDFGTKNRDNVGNIAGAASRDRFVSLQLGCNFWWESRY